jgi:hypothetical protein
MSPRHSCPECKSTQVLEIVYGYPGPDMAKDAEDGKIVLGGCCISDDDPKWRCSECGHSWGRQAHGARTRRR